MGSVEKTAVCDALNGNKKTATPQGGTPKLLYRRAFHSDTRRCLYSCLPHTHQV